MAYHEDADIERHVRNIWEYLKDVKENTSVFRWALHELIGEESKRWLRSMVIALTGLVTLEMVQPWLMRFIFDGLLTANTRWIAIGFCGIAFCRYTQIFCHYLQAKAREWVLGLVMGRTDQRICELFFEKSLGQHLQESSTLHVGHE